MKFEKTKLEGSYVIQIEPIHDERGFFARNFCAKEFNKYGLSSEIVQCNISYNKKRGTLRGMHYQAAPHEEAKIITCTRGAIYDVIIDLRPESVTYCQWIAIELNEGNYKMFYIPKGFAHGFQTLADNTVVTYYMSESYIPENAKGIRWNDPMFTIRWPLIPTVISEKDCNYQDWPLYDIHYRKVLKKNE